MGMAAAFGALCVSVIDQPGPLQHRLNGMLGCALLLVTHDEALAGKVAGRCLRLGAAGTAEQGLAPAELGRVG